MLGLWNVTLLLHCCTQSCCGCSLGLGCVKERTRCRVKPLPLERNRVILGTQIASQKRGSLKPLNFPKPPGQTLVSKSYNGYVSALFLCLHLSDGKLKLILAHSFHYSLRSKKVVSTLSQSMKPGLLALKCKNHRNSPFLRTEVQDVMLASFSLGLVMVWVLLSLRTSWLSTFPLREKEMKQCA